MRGVFSLRYLGETEFTKKTGDKVTLQVFYDKTNATLIKPFLDDEAVSQVKKLNENDEVKADIDITEYNGRTNYKLYQVKSESAGGVRAAV